MHPPTPTPAQHAPASMGLDASQQDPQRHLVAVGTMDGGGTEAGYCQEEKRASTCTKINRDHCPELGGLWGLHEKGRGEGEAKHNSQNACTSRDEQELPRKAALHLLDSNTSLSLSHTHTHTHARVPVVAAQVGHVGGCHRQQPPLPHALNCGVQQLSRCAIGVQIHHIISLDNTERSVRGGVGLGRERQVVAQVTWNVLKTCASVQAHPCNSNLRNMWTWTHHHTLHAPVRVHASSGFAMTLDMDDRVHMWGISTDAPLSYLMVCHQLTLGDCIMMMRASLDSTRMRCSASAPLKATLRRIDSHTAGSKSFASTRFTPGTCHSMQHAQQGPSHSRPHASRQAPVIACNMSACVQLHAYTPCLHTVQTYAVHAGHWH
eukprot:1148021-Pelagomonas_calceolata.AAC.4